MKRRLVRVGDPRLRNRPPRVTSFRPDLERHFEDMTETMFASRGVGLAATQVGLNLRIAVVLNVGSYKPSRRGKPSSAEVWRCVNLEILERYQEWHPEEGCLSLPGENGHARRAKWCVARFWDLAGNEFTMEAEDMQAQILQHEADHLDGRLFTDADRREWDEPVPA